MQGRAKTDKRDNPPPPCYHLATTSRVTLYNHSLAHILQKLYHHLRLVDYMSPQQWPLSKSTWLTVAPELTPDLLLRSLLFTSMHLQASMLAEQHAGVPILACDVTEDNRFLGERGRILVLCVRLVKRNEEKRSLTATFTHQSRRLS